MITSLEILQEAGEPMTFRELAREFAMRNELRIQYEDLNAVLQRQLREGKVKCVAFHKTDYRENKWQAT